MPECWTVNASPLIILSGILDQPDSIKPLVWEARERFEREQGQLTEEFDLPPREIAESTWRNPLDQ